MTVTDMSSRRSKSPNGGMVPPNDAMAEAALLGAMMLTQSAIDVATPITRAEDFYTPSHAYIFSAIAALYERGEPCDPVTVASQLMRDEKLELAGGHEALIGLQANTPATSNAARYAQTVADCARMRELMVTGQQIAALAGEWPQNAEEAIDQAQSLLFNMHRPNVGDVKSLNDGLHEWLDMIQQRMEQGGKIEYPSGFFDLDEKIGGLAPARLTVLAARPAMGKTSLSGALAANVAATGRPVLFVSVEMSFEELLGRFVAQASHLSGTTISRGRLAMRDMPYLNRGMDTVASLPIEVVDIGTATLMTIRSAARRVIAKRGPLGLIVVDYIQLMTSKSERDNRQVEVAEIARGLKIIARELKVPVLALSQLNRNLEYRAEKRPTLGDIRESGEIENSADAVIALYRDEVYNPESSDTGRAELIVLKNRHGETGTATIGADMRSGQWTNLANRERQM